MVGARSHTFALAALVALVAFAVVTHGGVSPVQADTDGAAMSLRVDASQQTGCPGGQWRARFVWAWGKRST